MSEKIVLGVTGMPGAGKATVRRMVEERGYPAVVMGDEIRLEAERRGLKPTPANLGELMLELRKEKGPAIVARRCTLKIEQAKA
nr:AAA family ATPase [Candidatus Bathyarchaeota archaeon]NIR17545.1 AAA family ATPase [Desulfobacterales bacterium]NIU81233.1 AAA family ATPase [Candidatus Bathyarchaeota archaeon]NIV67883.1 AAA family ATPase [Candidatus Bathyarchaeota archaeon]NIW16327.1 AAA family ATPase [Candidatus Bathyarchaeota archaeon]